jgi:hypothetical protein
MMTSRTRLLLSGTLSSTAQVILVYDLSFLVLTAHKFPKEKISEKNRNPGEVFSLSVFLQDVPATMIHF